jgi:hypothetical protein
VRRQDLEFAVGDQVLLRVSPTKGVVRFGVSGKLSPRYIGPFTILEFAAGSDFGVSSGAYIGSLGACIEEEIN